MVFVPVVHRLSKLDQEKDFAKSAMKNPIKHYILLEREYPKSLKNPWREIARFTLEENAKAFNAYNLNKKTYSHLNFRVVSHLVTLLSEETT
jgi:hypothetical protein